MAHIYAKSAALSRLRATVYGSDSYPKSAQKDLTSEGGGENKRPKDPGYC